MLAIMAISLVIAGDLALISTRVERSPFSLGRNSTTGLGLGFLFLGLLIGLGNLNSVLAWVAVALAVFNLGLFVYSRAQFAQVGDTETPDLDLDTLARDLQDRYSEEGDLLRKISEMFDLKDSSELIDDGGNVSEKCMLKLEHADNDKLFPFDGAVGGFKHLSGEKGSFFTLRRMTWTFFSLALDGRMILSANARAVEYTPVTGLLIAFSHRIIGPVPATAGSLIAGVSFSNQYSAQASSIYLVECDSECEAQAYSLSGRLSAVDGPLVVEIGPKGSPSGNDVKFDPEMQCVLGSNWAYSANVGTSGGGFSGGVRVSYTPSDLASGTELLGSYHWKCKTDSKPA